MLRKLLTTLWLAVLLGVMANSQTTQTTAPAATEQQWQRTALAEIRKRLAGREKEPAEKVFKNIEVLKGRDASRLPGMMSALTGLLGVDCTYCHIRDQWEKEDKAAKQITRRHFQMQAQMNDEFFAGQNGVTCWTCHRGQPKPESPK